MTQLTYASKVEDIDPEKGIIIIERLLDGGRERVEAKLPVMLAVVKDINIPRQPSILKMKKVLKNQVEKEMFTRLEAIREYLRSPMSDPHISMEEIFRKGRKKKFNLFAPLKQLIKKPNSESEEM